MTTYTRNTLSGSLAPVNNELEKIEVSLREKLDRNPSVAQNNEMLDDLDMNSNRIINYPDAVNDSDLITKGQVSEIASSLAPVQSVDGQTGEVLSRVQSVDGQVGNVLSRVQSVNGKIGNVLIGTDLQPSEIVTDEDGLLRLGANAIVGGNPQPNSSSIRDAFHVLRDVIGLTDCHGFADRTFISGVTDAGTYGTFDSVVTVQGSHTQDHVYSFQDRVIYEGSGTLSNTAGLRSSFTHAGTGNVLRRYGVEVVNAPITNGGTITSQYGIELKDLSGAAENTAINMRQSTGLAIASQGNAPSYHKGFIGIGGVNTQSVTMTYKNHTVSSSVSGFFDTNASTVRVGVIGDFPLEFVTGASVRWSVQNIANGSALEPFVNNSYDIGTISKLVRTVYSNTLNALGTTLQRDVLTPLTDLTFVLGTAGRRLANIFTAKITVGTTIWTSGSGSPEGVVTAEIGSLYTRTDGGAGTTLYVKESGVSNAGWVAK